MRWQTTPQFERDLTRLPPEHRTAFRESIAAFSRACDAYLSSSGAAPWPASLRVKPMRSAPGIWEMTWSFSGPDGRATFEFASDERGPLVRWRRIGTHGIFDRP